MPKPRLGLVVPALLDGGGVRSVAEFVAKTALDGGWDLRVISLSTSARDDHNVFFSKPSTWFRGPLTSEGTWLGDRFTHIGAFGGEVEFQRYRNRLALQRELSTCEVVQVVAGSPAWANAVLGCGLPVSLQVATRAKVERRMRDRELHGLSGTWRRAMTYVTDYLDDRALRCVDAIQVENQWMYDYVNKVARGRDIDLRYAPPGVDTALFHPLSNRGQNADRYILCVARLSDPRKNVRLLLEAYALLSDETRKNCRLVLAGASGPPASFWKRAQELGISSSIAYIQKPTVEDLAEIYRRAEVFVLPSDEEGLGVVVLEAMASGIPCVCTRSGGPDGIITNEVDGYLTPLNDAPAMAERLDRLLRGRDLNIQMGLAARGRIERKYALSVARAEFVSTWHKLRIRATEVGNAA